MTGSLETFSTFLETGETKSTVGNCQRMNHLPPAVLSHTLLPFPINALEPGLEA